MIISKSKTDWHTLIFLVVFAGLIIFYLLYLTSISVCVVKEQTNKIQQRSSLNLDE